MPLMNSGVYGFAAFVAGQEETGDTVSEPLAIATSAPVAVAPVADDKVDSTAAGNEGLSWTQKALFLAVIFGLVAVYIRMNTRSSSRGSYRQV